jgi:hypothetical protein
MGGLVSFFTQQGGSSMSLVQVRTYVYTICRIGACNRANAGMTAPQLTACKPVVDGQYGQRQPYHQHVLLLLRYLDPFHCRGEQRQLATQVQTRQRASNTEQPGLLCINGSKGLAARSTATIQFHPPAHCREALITLLATCQSDRVQYLS